MRGVYSALVTLLLVLASAAASGRGAASASVRIHDVATKKHCKIVKKHGHKKKVCTQARPKPTNTLVPTATETPTLPPTSTATPTAIPTDTPTATAAPTATATSTTFSIQVDTSWSNGPQYYCVFVSTNPPQPGATLTDDLTLPDGTKTHASSDLNASGKGGFLNDIRSAKPEVGIYNDHITVVSNGVTETADTSTYVTSLASSPSCPS